MFSAEADWDLSGYLRVVDPERIETFALWKGVLPEPLVIALRKRFGDRLRLIGWPR